MPITQSKSLRFATGLALMVALICLLAPLAAANSKHSRGHDIYWGAWIGSQLTGSQPPWDMSAVTRFEQMLGKKPSLLQFSGPLSDCEEGVCVPHPFPTQEMQRIRDYGAIPIYSWGSQPNWGPLEQPDFELSDVAGGAFDAGIREFAEAAREWGHPFFLRFDWEMNGSWFTWGRGVNGNRPDDFVAAWRHVHDVFKSVGATNATWVWCPYADAAHHFGDVKRFYPGNPYVDWTCMDGYNWARNSINPAPWRSFDQIFSTTYRKIVEKIAPKKPMMLGEVASNGEGRAKAIWIRNMFEALASRYPKIRAVSWFDQTDRDLNWPIETSKATIRAFAKGVRPARFTTNRYADLAAGSIRAPR